MQTVDVTYWKVDEQFSPYPEGSRAKYALISPPDCDQEGIVPNHRYLLKFSNPRYPVQFWSEIVAFRIAKLMGVPAPESFLSCDPQSGQPGSLTSWFYGKQIESNAPLPSVPKLPALLAGEFDGDDGFAPADAPESFSLYVPGSSYMARFIQDYDFKKGRQHNLKTLRNFVTRLRMKYHIDYWPLWSMFFVFDAIIGNTDRHQDNWGVLWRRDSVGNLNPRFAPAFDNGTSLLHEILERKLPDFADQAYRERYIRRGRHHIRIDKDAPSQMTHVELLQQIVEARPELASYMRPCCEFSSDVLAEQIKSLCEIECGVPFSGIRADAILAIVEQRRQIIINEILCD